jgi:hypothetical protein
MHRHPQHALYPTPFQRMSADYVQQHSNNFGNFLGPLAYALASTSLYGTVTRDRHFLTEFNTKAQTVSCINNITTTPNFQKPFRNASHYSSFCRGSTFPSAHLNKMSSVS